MASSPDYLEKEWENRLSQAIKLANVIRCEFKEVVVDPTLLLEDLHVRRLVEQVASTGPRSEATWTMAIMIAKEVK